MLNLHRLFYHHGVQDCYLSQLTLPELRVSMLREARRKVREALRDGIYKASKALSNEETVSPRFFTQGSWAYRTLNRATQVPPQQADMDDGCYLPMSFMKGSKPTRSAQWFFAVADAILEALVKKEGWQGYSRDKDCCCRALVDAEHRIDVPLYAIRDEAYQSLVKAAAQHNYVNLTEAFTQDDTVNIDWTILEREEVLLASRDGMWTASDPREVKVWADSIFAAPGGEQLRRVSRYVKGWRDQQYKNQGPSSILLMVVASNNFTSCVGRDDLALAEVAHHLPATLLEDVFAPWDGQEQINRLTMGERQQASTLAKRLLSELRYGLNAKEEEMQLVLSKLTAQFGRHFPTDAALISVATPAQTVAAFPAIATPTNTFPRSTRAG
ncbi:MAG: hypothetical protein HYX43_09690 [Burkholderiales bacterium]|nr:hypothetical protein [Burkholderiales bacterium]